MNDGKILYSGVNGVFVVRFIGDVRVTLCMTIENCLNLLIEDLSLKSVIVDLSEAEGIDSTSLGLIAKLGILGKKLTQKQVSIISTNSDITRLLVSMGFKDTLFVILDDIPTVNGDLDLSEVPNQSCTEQEAKQRVIEAHKILMNMNTANAAKFSDLVHVLEQSP